MANLPVNTDDWAGKYKGKTPANTDVNKFSNSSGTFKPNYNPKVYQLLGLAVLSYFVFKSFKK